MDNGVVKNPKHLQADVMLRQQCKSSDPVTFWLQTVPKAKIPVLTEVTVYALTMFGSAYR